MLDLFCFLSTTIPMIRFLAEILQMGPINFRNLIWNHKTKPCWRYVKVHLQVSPYPSCWWTTVSIARALKGGTANEHRNFVHLVGRKSIKGLYEWRWLIWKQHSNKAQEHKRTLIIELMWIIFEYYAVVFVNVIICAALVALVFQFCTFGTFFCPSLSSHFSSIISSWKLPKSAGVFHTTLHVTS